MDAQGMGGRRTRRHQSVSAGDRAAGRGQQGGGVVALMETGRGRKVLLDGRILVPTGKLAQVEDYKEWQLDGRRQARLAQGTTLGQPAWEVRADNQWRTAGGGAFKVDGRSTNGPEGGGGGCKEI